MLLTTSGAVPSLGHDPHPAKPMLGRERTAASVEALAAAPSGFTDQVTLTGLNHPTVVQFAANGRVFVAEKSGLIKVFDSLSDTTATVFADLRAQVDDYWDRGLLGLAVAPNFPSNPYVYVLYTYDAPIGGTAPVWNDACPGPPRAHDRRLRRERAAAACRPTATSARARAGAHQRLVPAVPKPLGRDRGLRARRGAVCQRRRRRELHLADYGQGGGCAGSPTPVNPCGDPAGEGGALRSQDVRPGPTGGSYSAAILADGPAAYWRVGEATTTSAIDEVGGQTGHLPRRCHPGPPVARSRGPEHGGRLQRHDGLPRLVHDASTTGPRQRAVHDRAVGQARDPPTWARSNTLFGQEVGATRATSDQDGQPSVLRQGGVEIGRSTAADHRHQLAPPGGHHGTGDGVTPLHRRGRRHRHRHRRTRHHDEQCWASLACGYGEPTYFDGRASTRSRSTTRR